MNIGKRVSSFWHKKRVESAFTKQRYLQQDLQTKRQNKLLFTAYGDQTFGKIKEEINKYIEQIAMMGYQHKKQFEDLIKLNRRHHTKMVNDNMLHTREVTKHLSNISHQQISTLISKFSKHIKEENRRLVEQISEQISEQTNHQISEFIQQISEENNKQSSLLIKQNTVLIREILSQSLRNHGAIDKKFEKFVNYQKLSEFRENLVIIKTNMIILERLDKTQVSIFQNLYLKYQKGPTKIPSLDITQGILIIKILFPFFFTEMLKKTFTLKNQFDDTVYKEMTDTVKECDSFFKNFHRDSDKLLEVKKMLDSSIATVDGLLIKMIDY